MLTLVGKNLPFFRLFRPYAMANVNMKKTQEEKKTSATCSHPSPISAPPCSRQSARGILCQCFSVVVVATVTSDTVTSTLPLPMMYQRDQTLPFLLKKEKMCARAVSRNFLLQHMIYIYIPTLLFSPGLSYLG